MSDGITPSIGTFPEWLERKAVKAKPKPSRVHIMDSVIVNPERAEPGPDTIPNGAARFALWSDGKLTLCAPKCRGSLSAAEVDALFAFVVALKERT